MGSQQATFQGYVHSTRDALLILEAVRRGILPKITRRLRDDERKTIGSGTIFVFDEVESSIKRWTDGMIWSPSRILNNFLVYREVEKKDPRPASDQPAFANSQSSFAMHPGSQYYGGGEMASAAHPSVRSVPLTLMPNAVDADGQMGHFKQEHGGYHGLDGVSSSSNAIYAEHDGSFANHAQPHHSNHGQTHAQAAGLVGLMDDSAGSSSAVKREAELDRTIVGSLTTSYPFLRDGLCKKTISIQVEGSTQHLISYYKIDDVHNGRLAIPSNLPEIAALSISPIFLHKSNFRYPPIVEIGPDGMPRYVAEATDNAMRTPGHVSSGTESYSSGLEARHDGLVRATSRSLSLYSPGLPPEAAHVEMHNHRYPHQIGGDGMLPASATLPPSTSLAGYRSRRSSDAPRRRANSRYEPYQAPSGHGMPATQLYTSSPSVDHGPVSSSGRRALFSSSRSHDEVGQLHPSEQAPFAMPRQDAFFGIGQVGHTGGANDVVHGYAMNQLHMEQGGQQQSNIQHPFQTAPMMPIVPSQPGRNHANYLPSADHSHGRSDNAGVKQEQSDPFHFSSRLTRGSWDSNQPSHSNSFLHNMQQPPATSQGLTAVSVHSHSNFGGPVYGRMTGSPPQTSSSLDSRHSYMGGGAVHATGRIGDSVEGVHPPTAGRLEDGGYSSRPISRAGEGGYVGDLDSAGVVRSGPLQAAQGHSDPNSPYPHTHHHPQHQQYQQFGHDGSGTEAYGRPEGVAEGQMPFYPQQSNHHHLSHDNAQIEQQGFGRAGHNTYESTEAYTSNDFGNQAAHNEQTWSSNPAAGGNSGADASRDFSSRPGTSHDQGYHQFSDEAVDGGSTNDSGLEKVMLTRPAS